MAPIPEFSVLVPSSSFAKNGARGWRVTFGSFESKLER
jgi:hypothetical protein